MIVSEYVINVRASSLLKYTFEEKMRGSEVYEALYHDCEIHGPSVRVQTIGRANMAI